MQWLMCEAGVGQRLLQSLQPCQWQKLQRMLSPMVLRWVHAKKQHNGRRPQSQYLRVRSVNISLLWHAVFALAWIDRQKNLGTILACQHGRQANLDTVLISQSTVVTSSPWGATVAKNNIAFCNVPWLSASWTPGDLMKYHEAISACEKGGEWLPVLQLLQQMMDEHVERCKWCMVWCEDENL